MKQPQLPGFEEEKLEINQKGEYNKSTNNLMEILSVEAEKCPSCDEISFYNGVCENCGYGKEIEFKYDKEIEAKKVELKAKQVEDAEVDITKVLNFDNNENHKKEFFKRLEKKDNCKMGFYLFGEFFDIEIKNGWVIKIEVSGLTFKNNNGNFIVVAKQKGFLRKKAYEYKRNFLKWIGQNKKKFNIKSKKNIKTHPYFDDFLGR